MCNYEVMNQDYLTQMIPTRQESIPFQEEIDLKLTDFNYRACHCILWTNRFNKQNSVKIIFTGLQHDNHRMIVLVITSTISQHFHAKRVSHAIDHGPMFIDEQQKKLIISTQMEQSQPHCGKL